MPHPTRYKPQLAATDATPFEARFQFSRQPPAHPLQRILTHSTTQPLSPDYLRHAAALPSLPTRPAAASTRRVFRCRRPSFAPLTRLPLIQQRHPHPHPYAPSPRHRRRFPLLPLLLPLFTESLPATLTSIVIPFVQDNPSTITDLLLRYAPEEDLTEARRLAIRAVHLNMASIHTSSIFTTHALFELARLPPAQPALIRAEIEQAIGSEGGMCNKMAVGKFFLLDSLLKEVGRFLLWAPRALSSANGAVLPRGSVVSLAPKPLHLNPKCILIPRLSTCSALPSRATRESSTVSNDYIVFGVGMLACPGRFFAALKIKIILAEILVNYDVSFPAGESTTPKPFAFNVFTMPNPSARLVFRKQKV
ncbi:cytochrome P450 [Mycena albidolilacea]|uniref:Cytochrome P450 n=1 Tax=Mycena albidolilacea TaxID=1033008 RepID=A0AAD7EJ79_9AGAR|nr:cytochrome P450 [Mycena albidolilacea]